MRKIGIAILFTGVVALVGGSRLLRLYNSDAVYSRKPADLYLKKSIGLPRLDSLLVDSLQVVKDKRELNWAANLLGWHTFQSGHYKINRGFTYEQFLSKLALGSQDPISITIIPGQRKPQIISLLANRMRFDSAAINTIAKDSLFLSKKNIMPKTLVAHFFPSTYEMYWTSPPKKVLDRIFTEFDNRITKFYHNSSGKQNLSFSEALTLASIIEGEAVHDAEKPKISGLYRNRLNKGMLLQADPTVNFILKNKRRLYFKDYKVDDPYNTYIHKGLPPGPINNPSLSSFKAALNPEKHDYIYMVARPNGYHAFSKTYAEHEQQSAEWRQYLKKMAKDTADTTTDRP